MPTDADATRLARRCLLCSGAALALAAAGAGLYVAVPAVRTAGWANVRVIEERETTFGRVNVVEVGRTHYLAYGPGTHVVFQSALDLDRPHELAAPYARLMTLGLVDAHPGARIAQLGVGAGTMTRCAIRTSRRRSCTASTSMMETDFFRIVAARLAPGGVAMQNVDTPQVDQPALAAAMQAAFGQIDAYRAGQGVVFAAYQGVQRDPAELAAGAPARCRLLPGHPLAKLLELRAGAV